jgi:hypothetical protein
MSWTRSRRKNALLLLAALSGWAAACAPRALRLEADRPRASNAIFDDADLRLVLELDGDRLRLRIDNHRDDAVEVRWEEAAFIGPDHRLASVAVLPQPGPIAGGSSIEILLGPLAVPGPGAESGALRRFDRRRAELVLPVMIGGVRREYHCPLRLRAVF